METLRWHDCFRRRLPAALLAVVVFSPAVQARPMPANPDSLFAHLKIAHPRLMLSDSAIAGIKAQVNADASLQPALNDMRKKSDSLLNVPVSVYKVAGDGSILQVSRTVLDRVYLLAFMAHYDVNTNYAARAGRELLAAAQFKDWNPGHFLDVAEMAHAFAIGYDWLYPYLTDAERTAVRAAIKDKAFTPAVTSFNAPDFWVNSASNWNVVCNSGLALAALAIGKEDPAAQDVLYKTLQSLQHSGSLGTFAPDGAYAEGIGYWEYSSKYWSTLFASMQSSLGEDFDMSRLPGLSETGMFALYCEGSSGRMVNYGDASDSRIYPYQMSWFSLAYHQPVYAWFSQKHAGHHVMELLWRDPKGVGASPQSQALPPSKYFRGPELAVFRGAWQDSDASFLAFKAGNPKNEHSHLDVGNFVFDAWGKRWATDLGPDSYTLPNYFIDHFDSVTRFTYYRVRAEGHNTLSINPGVLEDQEKWPGSALISFDGARQTAVGDITPAYRNDVSRALRGVSLQNGSSALIQDEIQLKAPGDIWWQMHTEAVVALAGDGKSAMLTQGTKRVWVGLLAPVTDARLTTFAAGPLTGTAPPPGQNPNKNVSVLALHLAQTQKTTIALWLVPLAAGAAPPAKLPAVAPLASAGWPAPSTIAPVKAETERPGLRWERGNLHVTLAGYGGFRLQLLDLRGVSLGEIQGSGPGDFTLVSEHPVPGLLLLRWRQGGGDRTFVLSRP